MSGLLPSKLTAPSSRLTGNHPSPVSCELLAVSCFLLRVEFDDELFLDREADVLALRHVEDGAAELLGIELEPCRNAASAGRLDGLTDLVVLAALLANLDHIALAGLVGGDVDLLAVHLDVTVAHELTRLGAGCGEAEGVDHVVQPELELAEKVLTGDARLALGALEVD